MFLHFIPGLPGFLLPSKGESQDEDQRYLPVKSVGMHRIYARASVVYGGFRAMDWPDIARLFAGIIL